jgi:NADPH:quinone reductase-like Zn-dependent oxidoreductase
MKTESMFAVYATKGDLQNPLAGLVVGERPFPEIPEGWVRVKVSHASLNRHDIFTLLGLTAQADPIVYPMIIGNDGAGTVDDGTEVAIYPVMGSDDWKGDETLDPHWHIFSEIVQGTFADFVVMPKRNAVPRPAGLSAAEAAVMGTAWLTAYRMLFTKSNLKPGQTMLVQGATGGMATALIQLGKAAGVEVWVTSRSKEGREMAERLGADRTFGAGETLPKKVDAVMDNVGQATWSHSLESVRRGGTVLTVGITTGNDPSANLLKIFVEQITVAGTIMGTLDEFKSMMNFIVRAGIKPEIGEVIPMTDAERAIRDMAEGKTHGKTVFTR